MSDEWPEELVQKAKKSSLDTKLKEILDSYTDMPLPNDKFHRKGQDGIISQIRQAFTDDGWVK